MAGGQQSPGGQDRPRPGSPGNPRWWQHGKGLALLIMGVLALLIALVVNAGPPSPQTSTVADPADAPSFTDDLNWMALDAWSGIADPAATPESLEKAAREKCAEETRCSVYAWADEANRGRSLPMLDREAAARVFTYDVNRASGFERSLRDCKRWPSPADVCL